MNTQKSNIVGHVNISAAIACIFKVRDVRDAINKKKAQQLNRSF